ncbi:MAG: HlyC/CorC family transporter, partial [Polyangiaceae bacterium]|nr:HlyC/CorC family transporter [Polyangiaceae bacterium]
MDDPGIQAVVGIAVGVVFGAIFSALSAGVGTLGEVRLRAMAEAGGRLAPLARRALDDGHEIRSRLLVARVACLTVAAALATIDSPSVPWLGNAWAVVGVALAYAASAQLASAIAVRRPPEAMLRLYGFFRPFELLVMPVVAPLVLIDRAVGRLLPPPRESPYAERLAELAVEHVLEQGEEDGAIAEEQAKLLWNVLEFKNTVAREIMVPRTQIIAFELETDIETVLASIIEHGHSRYPVYRKSIDEVEGILYAKDLFRAFGKDQTLAGLHLGDVVRRPAFFVPEGQKIGTLLREMQARRFHMSIVADEFGGVAGLVTLEDVVEEIVGEIQDEHDAEEPMIRILGDGRFEALAGISLYDLEEYLGEPLHVEEGDFDS